MEHFTVAALFHMVADCHIVECLCGGEELKKLSSESIVLN